MIDFDSLRLPEDLKRLTDDDLPLLAEYLRSEIIDSVSANGGHLASSLGAVELCIALHRVFDLPECPVFFDVGHQAYAHKILTGRGKLFRKLRQTDGCSGFPSPAESIYDPASAGHAGVAISLALGAANALEKQNPGQWAIAVAGDGSLTCGISFEALNCAKAAGKRLIIILNDNQMAISPNVGSLARCLNRVISGKRYNRLRSSVKQGISSWKSYRRIQKIIHRLEDIIKGMLLPPGVLFQELDVRYLGPVKGNDLSSLIPALERIKQLPEGPVLLHVITRKGYGYEHAEQQPSKYHGVSEFDPEQGLPDSGGKQSFSAAFGKKMVELADRYPDLEAVSAAMLMGTGLTEFSRCYPERCHDVGIAEEHAVAFSAGLSSQGKKVVCAMYSTFLQRALDCIHSEVVMNGFPVVFAVDRAGVVEDGPTHHGIYDLGFLRQMPGLQIMAPATVKELEAMLEFALAGSVPTVIRYPKGSGAVKFAESIVFEPLTAGRSQIVRRGGDRVVLWALGPELDVALEAAEQLAEFTPTVINVRFISPFDRELAMKYCEALHITIEDHSISGGIYSTLCEAFGSSSHGAVIPFGWPQDSIPGHGEIPLLRKQWHLTAPDVVRAVKDHLRP